MAKHPVPKYKTTRTKTRQRHSSFMAGARKKLEGIITKMQNLEKKGNLSLRVKTTQKLVKKVKA